MPKGVSLTVDQFIARSVGYLLKKSPDAREIILSGISRGAEVSVGPKTRGPKPGAKKAKVAKQAAPPPPLESLKAAGKGNGKAKKKKAPARRSRAEAPPAEEPDYSTDAAQ